MIHAVTCTYCNCPITGRILKDEFKQTVCLACFNGETITPVVAVPTATKPPCPQPVVAVPPPQPPPKRKERTPTHLQIDTSKHGCIVVGCLSPVRSRRLCCPHYCIARRTGQIDKMPKLFWVAAPENIDTSKCSCIAIGCNRARKTRGFCGVHYNNVLKHKQTHLLLPAIPLEVRNESVRHISHVDYLTPEAVMHEIVRIKKSGKTWHQAALLSGAQQPLCAANRTRGLFYRGKIPGHTPPNPHR